MKPSTLAAIAAILGGIILTFDLPLPTPPELDTLGQCYAADRESKIRIIEEMAGREFDSDSQQAEWWNAQIEQARTDDFQAFVDVLAVAIEGDKVKELAESL